MLSNALKTSPLQEHAGCCWEKAPSSFVANPVDMVNATANACSEDSGLVWSRMYSLLPRLPNCITVPCDVLGTCLSAVRMKFFAEDRFTRLPWNFCVMFIIFAFHLGNLVTSDMGFSLLYSSSLPLLLLLLVSH